MQARHVIYDSLGGFNGYAHLCSPDGIFAVAECTREGCKMHYVHTDNLGSWDIHGKQHNGEV